MLTVPEQLNKTFETQLSLRNIPVHQRSYFHKWLRYYLDFCVKYCLDANVTRTFAAFNDKLKSKGQTESQRQQARQSIGIYYRMVGVVTTPKTHPVNPVAENSHNPVRPSSPISPDDAYSNYPDLSAVKTPNPEPVQVGEAVKLAGANWEAVHDQLHTAIKVRHYSNKTWQAYRYWLQQFQIFTKSKDSRLLSMDDVKGFLSHLAVNKQVAASSQNQAFNALLFLFKNVLQKEFGKVEGVVRAKRRPYIPVVLSRPEVDRVIGLLEPPYYLVAKLLYGCGLRLFECLKLRVQDLNFDMKVLTVHDGKGQKDRTLPMPETLIAALSEQIGHVAVLHQADLAGNYAGVFLPSCAGRQIQERGQGIGLAMVISRQNAHIDSRQRRISSLSFA